MNRLNHRMLFICLMLTPTLMLCACNGGGGSVHVPPLQIIYGQPTQLQLELSAWGSPPLSGKLSKRYTNVCLHYKTEHSTDYTIISAKITSERKEKLLMAFDLPVLKPADGTYIEYWMDFNFDGHYNKREKVKVPLCDERRVDYGNNKIPHVCRTGDPMKAM